MKITTGLNFTVYYIHIHNERLKSKLNSITSITVKSLQTANFDTSQPQIGHITYNRSLMTGYVRIQTLRRTTQLCTYKLYKKGNGKKYNRNRFNGKLTDVRCVGGQKIIIHKQQEQNC